MLLQVLGAVLLASFSRQQPATQPDEGCDAANPLRCADGVCRKDCSAPVLQVPLFCSDPIKNFQCVNNTCVTSYAECKALSGLTFNSTNSCSDSSFTRCKDGFCRRNCSTISYSNCPPSMPIKCGDGRCTKFEYQCSTHTCPFNRPFLCPDMTCARFLKNCTTSMAFRVFKRIEVPYNLGNSMSKIGMDIDGFEENGKGGSTMLFTLKSHFEIFAPPENSPNWIELNGKPFNDNCTMIVDPVSWDEIENVTNEIEVKRSISFDEDYPFEHTTVRRFFTVRSPLVKLSTTGRKDNNEYFAKPVKLLFNYNPIKASKKGKVADLQVIYYHQKLLCLGTIMGEDQKSWFCVSRKIISTSSTALGSQIEYEVPGPGVYAVIFRPDLVVLHLIQDTVSRSEENYCGFVCKYKVLILVYIIIAIPFILWGFQLVNTVFMSYQELGKDQHKVENVYKKIDAISHKTVAQLEREEMGEKDLKEDLKESEMFYVTNPIF